MTGSGFTTVLRETTRRIAQAYKFYTPKEQAGDLTVMITVRPNGTGRCRAWTSLRGGRTPMSVDLNLMIEEPTKIERSKELAEHIREFAADRQKDPDDWRFRRNMDYTWEDVSKAAELMADMLIGGLSDGKSGSDDGGGNGVQAEDQKQNGAAKTKAES